MATNINFTNDLNGESDANISYNLPRKIYRDSLKRAVAAGATAEAESCTYNIMLDMDYKRLLNRASLLVTPTLYKEGVLYPQIPTYNSNGDFSVTRATTATRVNAAGLVELVPYNLVTYSEQFDDASWVNSNITLTPNTTTAPNGTLTADTLIATTANTQHSIQQNITISQISDLTFSCYVKNNGGNFVQLVVGAIPFTNSNPYQNFNLQTGTLANGTVANSTITNVGNGWYRITMTTTNSGTGVGSFFIIPILNGTTGRVSSFAGDGINGIYVWGAQLVEGSSALDYQATETRLNIPRLDYSNGSCPSLLVEPQRTNLLTYSEQFDSAAWTKVDTTITSNAVTAPNGTLSADRLFETATNGGHGFYQNRPLLTGVSYTLSCFVKKGNRDYCGLQFWYSTSIGAIAFFNLSTGALVYEFAEGSGYSVTNSRIENVGNGWYRLSAVFTVGISDSYPGLVIAQNQWTTGTSYDNYYLGDTSKYIDIWGAQLEAGAYATSYIPTSSASVTRNADVVQKTGVSSLIGQTEGTIVFKANVVQPIGLGIQNLLSASNDSEVQTFFISYVSNTGRVGFDFYIGGSYSFALTSISPILSGVNIIGIVYKAGAYKLYINGSQVASSTNSSPITNTISTLRISSGAAPMYYDFLNVWKTVLTDDQLELLTGDSFDTYAEMASYYNYTLQ